MEPLNKQTLDDAVYILIIGLVLLLGFTNVHTRWCHEKEMDEIHSNTLLLKEINYKIDKRSELDSAYHYHLTTCGYLDRRSMYVDGRGYIKSTYRPDALSQAQ